MPYLNLRTVKGMLSAEDKKYLMDKFTELLVQIEGGGDKEFAKFVWIEINEEDLGNWQLGEFRPSAGLIASLAQKRQRVATK